MATMQMRADVLAESTDGLEHALGAARAGHELEWTDEVGSALANVEQAIRLHASMVAAPDGLFSKVELTRPTFVRQIGELRREHTTLLDRAHGLQLQLRGAAQAFQPSRDSLPGANAMPEPARVAAIPDFGSIRQATEQFLAALQHHMEDEARLLLDSVNTDIGVGD